MGTGLPWFHRRDLDAVFAAPVGVFARGHDEIEPEWCERTRPPAALNPASEFSGQIKQVWSWNRRIPAAGPGTGPGRTGTDTWDQTNGSGPAADALLPLAKYHRYADLCQSFPLRRGEEVMGYLHRLAGNDLRHQHRRPVRHHPYRSPHRYWFQAALPSGGSPAGHRLPPCASSTVRLEPAQALGGCRPGEPTRPRDDRRVSTGPEPEPHRSVHGNPWDQIIEASSGFRAS